MAESIGKRGEHGSQNLHQRATLTKLVLSQGNYYVGTNKAGSNFFYRLLATNKLTESKS